MLGLVALDETTIKSSSILSCDMATSSLLLFAPIGVECWFFFASKGSTRITSSESSFCSGCDRDCDGMAGETERSIGDWKEVGVVVMGALALIVLAVSLNGVELLNAAKIVVVVVVADNDAEFCILAIADGSLSLLDGDLDETKFASDNDSFLFGLGVTWELLLLLLISVSCIIVAVASLFRWQSTLLEGASCALSVFSSLSNVRKEVDAFAVESSDKGRLRRVAECASTSSFIAVVFWPSKRLGEQCKQKLQDDDATAPGDVLSFCDFQM
jgi:hypothetical protein